LLRVIDEIFARLKVPVTIKINNRKILAGLAEKSGAADKLTVITTAIDKLEKTGKDAVISELREKGLSQQVIDGLTPVFDIKGDNDEKLTGLRKILSGSQEGMKGIAELETLTRYLGHEPLRCGYQIDLTLARGLNYYTGAIIEVKADGVNIGSICGGGRYDNLTGIFGLEGVSGVGVSFGADRIYDVMLQEGRFEDISTAPCRVLIINFGSDEHAYALKILKKLHSSGVSAMIYPDDAKIGKQMAYANTLKIPYVALAGEDEIKNGEITIKNMLTGTQQRISLEETGNLFP
ncbi:MAG: histidine--tRNA ligase family protein, partial [Bacteroidales bacterium]|nr:histidine--tRNA ligase family protein [Bacteroidales bacterium]